MNWIVVSVVAILSFGLVLAERVEIKPGKTFCCFRNLLERQNYGVQFQSDEGEFRVYVLWVPINGHTLDGRFISQIAGPAGIIYDTSKDAYGSFNFSAKQAGRYEICFENNIAGGQARRINFNELGELDENSSKSDALMLIFGLIQFGRGEA